MRVAILGAFGRASRPLAWYYAIAVAVPVLNGARPDGAFLEHVASVLIVPVLLVMVAGSAMPLVSRWRRKDTPGARDVRRDAGSAGAERPHAPAPR
jgi:hypothetical protein